MFKAVPTLALGGALRRDSQQVLGAAAIVMTLTVTTGAFVAGLAARGPEPSDG